MKSLKYFASSFIWGLAAKLLDAVAKFITIPLLLHYFGKESYGLLTLVFAANAYMQLLDLGINTGAVKYFSQWIAEKKHDLIQSVSRTSISFYLIIGLINSIILIFLSFYSGSLFNVSSAQADVLETLFLILAFFSFFNWSTFVLNQLLIADEKIAFIQQVGIGKSFLNIGLVLTAINLHLSLTIYFISFLTINSLVILPLFLKAKHLNLINSFVPGRDWLNFQIILKYSLAIFAMGIFQFTATQSRPIILGMFNVTGVGILSDYRVIEVFPIFIISIGGMILTILLPKSSKLVQLNDRKKIKELAYNGTSYTSILVLLLCFPVIINSRDLLMLYVGEQYIQLAPWLSLWVFTIVLFLHNSPVASLVLATGKTKVLVYSSAIACTVSLIINAVLCPMIGIGSAVVGYLVYIIIQMSFYYLYFNSRILKLESFKVFMSFIVPTFIAVLISVPLFLLDFNSFHPLSLILIKLSLWFFSFGGIVISLKLIDVKQLVASLKRVNS